MRRLVNVLTPRNDQVVIPMRRTEESGIPTYVQDLENESWFSRYLFWQRLCFDKATATWMRQMLGLFFLIQAGTFLYLILKVAHNHSVADGVLAAAVVICIQLAGCIYCFLKECFQIEP